MSALALDLRRTAGFLVADARGRIVGRVECPMYGTSPEEPDALSVRSGFLSRRRRLVPAGSIEQIDEARPSVGPGGLERSEQFAPEPISPGRQKRLPLEHAEVAIQFPLRELNPVLVPLLPLQAHVVVEDVIAEGPPHQVGGGELVDRLAERLRQ